MTYRNTTGKRPRAHDGTPDELRDLRRRCARQRRELERLKAIVTVASTSDVENVIIVKATAATDGETREDTANE